MKFIVEVFKDSGHVHLRAVKEKNEKAYEDTYQIETGDIIKITPTGRLKWLSK